MHREAKQNHKIVHMYMFEHYKRQTNRITTWRNCAYNRIVRPYIIIMVWQSCFMRKNGWKGRKIMGL